MFSSTTRGERFVGSERAFYLNRAFRTASCKVLDNRSAKPHAIESSRRAAPMTPTVPARFFAPSLQSFVPSGSWASRLAPGVPALLSSRPRCAGSRRHSIQVTLAQGTTGDDATVGCRASPTKNAARPTRIMRVMPTPSFRLARCASISAINDSDHDQTDWSRARSRRRAPLDARDRRGKQADVSEHYRKRRNRSV